MSLPAALCDCPGGGGTRTTRRVIFGLVAVLAVSVGVAAFATSAQAATTFPCGGGGTYTVDGAAVTGNDGCAGAVTVHGSVTSIGDYAFAGAGALTSVTIPDGVTSIGVSAFDGASVTSVTIGSGVTNIGAFTFRGASALVAITVDVANTRYSSRDGVLFDKLRATLRQYPRARPGSPYTIPVGVNGIGDSAFERASALTSVTIPDSVTSIGVSAFLGASALTSVTIGSGVTNIGAYAFYNASALVAITVDVANTRYSSRDGVLFDKLQATLMQYPRARPGSPYTIPVGVTGIGDYAFEGASALTSVTIPDSVISIGDYGFFVASALTSVTIGSGVTGIGDFAFVGTSALTRFLVSDANSVCSSRDGVLFNKARTTLMQYPRARPGSPYTIPDGVTGIGDSAFAEASALVSVTIPDGVLSIGASAFEGSSALTSATIGSGVASIGDNAFYDASVLTSAIFLGNAPSIGSSAFVHVAAGAKAYRAAGLTGYGDDGSDFHGLIVATPTSPVASPVASPAASPVASAVAPDVLARPAVTWRSVAKTRSVVATVTPADGVTYSISASSGAKRKSAPCRAITLNVGKKTFKRFSCTLKLAKGRWTVTVTPKRKGFVATADSKQFAFR